MNTTPEILPEPGSPEESAKRSAMIVYILQALSILLGFTSIVGVIINYVKRKEVAGTIAESHFDWQIKTFWWSLGAAILGMVLTVIGIGALILIAVCIWYVYRVVRGLMALLDNKPITAKF